MSKIKSNFLYGLIIRSSYQRGQIANISIPSLDPSYFIISNEDIVGKRFIEIDNQRIEIFANNEISYLNQPILALFGPNYEELSNIASQIDISYRHSDSYLKKPEFSKNQHFDFSFGESINQNLDSLKKVSSNTQIDARKSQLLFNTYVDYSSKIINIETTFLDKSILLSNLLGVCSLEEECVKLINLPNPCNYDEFYISPILTSIIATLAYQKSKKSINLIASAISKSQSLNIKRDSYLDSEDNILYEDIDVNVDLGSKNIFSDEIMNQMILALLPLYNVKGLKIRFSFLLSDKRFASFFQGLGFNEAQISRITHERLLSKELKLYDNEFQLKYYSNENFLDIKDISSLSDMIKNLSINSDFDRKFAAYEYQGLNYHNGISMSSGFLSSGYKMENEDYKVGLSLDSTFAQIHSSFNFSDKELKYYLSILKDILETNTLKAIQSNFSSGPDLLYRKNGVLLKKLVELAIKIKERRFVDALPIYIEDSLNYEKKEIRNFASLITKVNFDPFSFKAIIKDIYLSICFYGKRNTTYLEGKIKTIIIRALLDNNFLIDDNLQIKIYFDIKDEGFDDFNPQSLSSLVLASALNSLSQAINKEYTHLPFSKELLLSILTKESKE